MTRFLDAWNILATGPKFVEMTKLLLTDFSLCTYNAGHFSSSWVPTRGLYQGNPVGPGLFLLVIEALSIQLCVHPAIEGVSVKDIHYLLSQFADDMDMFIKCKREVWEVTMGVLDSFESCSGMKINCDKTTVYRIGSLFDSDTKFYMAIKDSNTCTFCSNRPETLEHLFVTCDKILPLWHYYTSITNVQVNKRRILLNTFVTNPACVENVIGLIVKQYIYATRCLGQTLNKMELSCKIKRWKEIEYYIAEKYGRLSHHETKWECN